jgi:predicted hydrocarbon binding protein
MAHSLELAKSGMIALSRESMVTLRGVLFRDLGPDAATYFQEAGYAGGEELYRLFGRWMDTRGLGTPESLPTSEFGRRATEFFRDLGWGGIELATLRESVATIDSLNWAEADPSSGLEFPGCHLTTGMFADFFSRLAGSPLAVMEVECRSMGGERCRFLLGSAEVMQELYDAMSRGVPYEEANV